MDVRTNQSYQTKDAVLKYYEYRVDALLKKINDLESKIELKDSQLDTLSKELNIY